MLEVILESLTRQLLALGVQPGGVLLVHCALSRVKPVAGGPAGLIAALRAALGPGGTLVMPSMSDDDERPFDPRASPCPWLGIVADTFWRMPGVLRSDNPHTFAALGPSAAHITAPHPLDVPHGHDSPVGRVYDLDGQVLLLGIDHTANTTIHLAENLAGVRYRRQTSLTILQDGRPARFQYAEIDHCCQNFARLDGWLDAAYLQRRGTVGQAQARLVRSRDVVGEVVPRLKAEETLFLHPFGVDEECDEARGSMLAGEG
jgi:aminoglycoside 3-N-acetyltransferase